jgi:glycosyltransferase involved in cell wall biosynthesis
MTSVPEAVSVVMPARNAARTIGLQLEALARQTYRGDLEVVVVDNDSDDDTAAIARSWRSELPGLVVVGATTGHSVSHARNAGIAAAHNDLVLVCDADDVVDAEWVEQLARVLAGTDVAAGSTLDWDGGRLPTGDPELFGTGGFGFLPSFGGCNFGVRRRVWDALGGFDESLRSGEDVDFAWRAQLAGFALTAAPSAVVFYRVETAPRAVLRKWKHDASYQPALYARFRADGMERQRVARVLARYVALAVTSYRYFSDDTATRTAWCRELGRRVGRIRGSIRTRTLYL